MEPAGNGKGEIRRRCAIALPTTTAPGPDGKPISRGEMPMALPVSGGFM
jgi:hypothetical protein